MDSQGGISSEGTGEKVGGQHRFIYRIEADSSRSEEHPAGCVSRPLRNATLLFWA